MSEVRTRRQAAEFRERIALGLQALGVSARPVPPAKRPSEAFSGPFGHVVLQDVPSLTVMTRASFEFRPTELLDIAERAAADDGNDLGVAVQFRQLATVEEQFAVMSLKTLAVLLADRRAAHS
jgi:hypothetical protein